MKLWEGIIKRRIRMKTIIREGKLRFMLKNSMTNVTFAPSQLPEKHKKNRSTYVFINIEKAYDIVPTVNKKFGDV